MVARLPRTWLSFWAPLLGAMCAAAAVAQPSARVAWPIPSAGARVSGGVLYSLDFDLRGVRAVDLATERLLWQTRAQDAPRGGHDLQLLPGGRVLLVAGAMLVVLDPASGAIVARHTLDDASFGERSFFSIENGICAMSSACAFQIVDCAVARPIGEPLRGALLHRARYDRSGIDQGCWSFRVERVGHRAGRFLLDVAGHARPGAGRQVDRRARPVRLSIDARTGVVRDERPVGEPTRRPATPVPAPATVLEVLRDYNGGARRAEVRRTSDGALVDRIAHDAWLLGEHAGLSVVFVHRGEATPGEVRVYRTGP